jgi:hypothetical protein
MWTSASFPCATASSMLNPAASEALDVAAIVNSMTIWVLRWFPWESNLHNSRVIANSRWLLANRA